MTGTQKRSLYMPNTVPTGPLSPLQLQGLPSFFFSFRPRRGFPPTLISVPTAPDRIPGPGSTAVTTSFIKVLALNQLSGTLPPPGTLTDADYSGRKRMVART